MTEETVALGKPARNDLTAEFVRQILDYNQGTGIFLWKYRDDVGKKWNSKNAGNIAGTYGIRRYPQIKINGVLYACHRLAWLYVHGRWPKCQIDHIDRNGHNNRISNLRECTPLQNSFNRNLETGKKTKKGVFLKKDGFYEVSIQANRKAMYLGRFRNEEEAHKVYVEAALKYHGEFALTE